MANYYIDLETLQITKKRFNLIKFVIKNFLYIFLTIWSAIILTIILLNSFPTPSELRLTRQTQSYIHKFMNLNQKISSLNHQLQELATTDNQVYRNIFGLSKSPAQWMKAGIGGQVSDNFTFNKIINTTALNLKLVAKQIEIQANSYKELIDVIHNKELMASSIPAIQPISNKDLIRFGSPFGWRIHPIYHVLKFHEGIDLTARRGTPVYATGDGIVIRADAASRGYGKHIRIAHGFGYVTLYAHLSKILVKPGQRVHRGDLIGLVGSTGLSTAPHLHYEVRFNGKPVNPINFYYNDMTDEEYQMMIQQARTANTHIYE